MVNTNGIKNYINIGTKDLKKKKNYIFAHILLFPSILIPQMTSCYHLKINKQCESRRRSRISTIYMLCLCLQQQHRYDQSIIKDNKSNETKS